MLVAATHDRVSPDVLSFRFRGSPVIMRGAAPSFMETGDSQVEYDNLTEANARIRELEAKLKHIYEIAQHAPVAQEAEQALGAIQREARLE
jgi:hypothetical protein